GAQSQALPVHPWSKPDDLMLFLHSAQILRRRLPSPPISHNLVGNLLSLVEAVHAGALDCADVHEHILAAVVRLDEAEAFLAVEPLHSALSHSHVFRLHTDWLRVSAAGSSRDFGEGRCQARYSRRGQVIRAETRCSRK